LPICADDLIDQIYEAALLPEIWPDVLERVAALSGATKGGVLFAMNAHFSGWKASQAMLPLFSEYTGKGWAARNRRPARALAMNHAGFVSDDQLFSREEMDKDPFYQWLRKQGGGWCFGTLIQIPAGDAVIFSWERSFELGPFDAPLVESFDPLRPHLARASLISGRLALERARVVTETLALLRLPAAVLSHSYGLMATNELLDQLIPSQLQDCRKRVTLTDPRADRLFEEALAALSRMNGSAPVSSIALAGTEDHPPSILHLVPVRRAARDLFAASFCLLILTSVSRPNVPAAAIVQALFDLTPAEARVAAAIAQAQALEEVAAGAGLSVNTVKSQLQAVFSKTGVSRQAELVALLAGTALPR
jgi:DNA-binding CsgD family transcriptional regulator